MLTLDYARCSELERETDLDHRRRDLKAAGCDRIIIERTPVAGNRPELDKCMALLREGDVLVASRLDRLAASAIGLVKIIDSLAKRRVGVVVLSIGGPRLNSLAESSRLAMTVLRGVGLADKAALNERARPGIEAARAAGKYLGRLPVVDRAAVHQLAQSMSATRVAEVLGIGRRTVYGILGPGGTEAFRATVRKPPPTFKNGHRQQPICAETVQRLSRSMGPSQIARPMGISLASVRRLRGESHRGWR